MKSSPTRFIVFLDVGHGNSCVMRDDNGVIVIDTGLGTGLLEFLDERGIKKVDVVLLSHADKDHISGLIHLLASNEVEIGRVRLNTDAAKKSRLWKNLVHELEVQESQKKLNWEVQLTADSSESYSVGRVKISIVAPGKTLAALGPGNTTEDDEVITTNSISCVVHLSQDGRGIAVIPGDIDDVGLRDLARRLNGAKLAAPVLVYPHHGGHSGAEESEFAEAVCDMFSPSTVVFSIGRGRYGTPRPAVVESVRRRVKGIRIICTQLSEHCSQYLPQNDPSHLLPIYAEGKSERVCCAGSIMIDLDSHFELFPEVAQHDDFLDKQVGSALCRRNLP